MNFGVAQAQQSWVDADMEIVALCRYPIMYLRMWYKIKNKGFFVSGRMSMLNVVLGAMTSHTSIAG